MTTASTRAIEQNVIVGESGIVGDLVIPKVPKGLILFAHGSGSSRLSVRNRYIAGQLQAAGFATLLVDLLSEAEEQDRRNVFDIELLARRLHEAHAWATRHHATAGLPIAYFGASTGAAAALVAAGRHPYGVCAVVSRGGRPDLAADDLPNVLAPTLLIVGGADAPVIEMNRYALDLLCGQKELVIVSGATHLFPEPGALEQVADLAAEWFLEYVPESKSQTAGGSHRPR
jgi:pimeloyl-ACP methyl ester carboxylesterase